MVLGIKVKYTLGENLIETKRNYKLNWFSLFINIYNLKIQNKLQSTLCI